VNWQLRPYPSYKDSGAPWLGEVPTDWEVAPAIAAYRSKLAKNLGLIEQTVLSLSYGQIIVKPPERLHGLVPESFETYQLVEPGDIIIRPTDLQNDKTSLRVGIAQHRGIITSAYMRLQVQNRMSSNFGYLLLHAYDLLKVLYSYGSGLRQNLDFTDIKRMPILLPSPSEQLGIIRFLKYEDRRIRRFIHAKRELIKLLNEQRQVVINGAVTQGIDSHVNLKKSSIPWVGDVPDHWVVKPLKYVAPQVTVGIVIQPASLYVSDGVPCLRSLNVSKGTIDGADLVFISKENNVLHRKSQIFEGDIVVVRTGRAGVAAIVTREFDGANCIDLLIVRRSSVILSDYLLMYLNSRAAKAAVELKSVGAIQAHYNTSTLANLVVLTPPLAEQQRILDWLMSTLKPVDFAIETARREIELMREYRTRLIADVVTGKLDVREPSAKLPDEPEESVAPDLAEVLGGRWSVSDSSVIC